MKLIRFDGVAEFLEHAESFLLAREAKHNLILGICNGLTHGEWSEQPPYLAVVEDGGSVVLAAARTPPHTHVLSHCDSEEPVEVLLDGLSEGLSDLPGVNGPSDVAEAFVKRWRSATGGLVELSMAQRIYQLDQVEPVARVGGRLRRANVADRPLIVEWLHGFHESALGGSWADAERAADRYLSAQPGVRGLYLWETASGPVSMAGYAGVTPNGVRVGAVYTPPAERRKGYATAAVAALSQQLLDSGRRFCFLYTDLANPTSNHIYQEIGYRPVSDSSFYRFHVSEEPASA